MVDTIERVLIDVDAFVNRWRNSDEVPFEIKSSIITQIIRTRSIDTTKMIQSVDYRETSTNLDTHRFVIDNSRDKSVYYAGFVEFDGETRNYVGRFNFRDGITNANIQRISDSIADDSFHR